MATDNGKTGTAPPRFGLRHVKVHRPLQRPVIYQLVPEDQRRPLSRRDILRGSVLSLGALGVNACGGKGESADGGEPELVCVDAARAPLDEAEYRAFTEGEIRAHPALVHLLRFSLDGSLLISAGGSEGTRLRDHTDIKVWSVPDGRLVNSLSNDYPASKAQFSADGTQLFVHASTGVSTWDLDPVRLRSIITGVSGQTWLVSNGFVKMGRISNNDTTGDYWFGLAWWNLASGAKPLPDVWRTLANPRPLYDIRFNHNSSIIALAFRDGSVDLHDGPGVQPYLRSLGGHADPATMEFSPDGALIATASGLGFGGLEASPDLGDTTIRICDVASGATLHTLTGHGNRINALAFSADGGRLVSGSGGNVSTSGLPSFTTPGTAVAPSAFDENSVRVWDTASGAELFAVTDLPSRVLAVAISPDGQYVAAGSQDNTVKLWRVADGQLLAGLFDSSALEPDKTVNYVATGLVDGTPVQRALPIEAELPAAAGCTCNCVAGSYKPRPPKGGGGPCHLVCVCVPVTFPGIF